MREIVFRNSEIEVTPEKIEELSKSLSVSKILSQILLKRGIEDEESARAFLYPSLKEHLPDPSLMKNIDEAARIILSFVEKKEQITIFTDFDVDGVTSGAQLLLFLEALGGVVNTYTPSRFKEGYGLSKEAVRKLAESGTKLLVTADCGISNEREIALAKEYGLSVVVIDHHIPHTLPVADCIVNPAQDGCPFQDYKLATAGIIWLLLIVLRRELKKQNIEAPDPKDFLDLASLGTICDMVPLTKLNRLIAARGVEALSKTKRTGLIALKDSASLSNKRFSAGHVSFALGPRINASGRLDHAGKALELLATSDSIKAKKLADRINRLNTERRGIEEKVKKACISELGDSVENAPAFAIYGEDFHIGVIGLAAQRLVENFYKPSAVMGPGEAIVKGEVRQVIKGSVRTIKGFHVANALSSLGHLLLNHGGHAEAGGFSLLFEHLDEFKEEFVKKAKSELSEEHYVRHQSVDIEVKLSDIDFKTVEELSKLAPFGIANPSPVLLSRKVRVGSVSILNGGHLRLKLHDDSSTHNAVFWGAKGHPLIRKDNIVDVCYKPEIQNFRGISSVQLNISHVA